MEKQTIIISVADFPNGAGRTQRLITLARAMRDSGRNVRIWIKESAYGLGVVNSGQDGEVHGIPYRHFSHAHQRPTGFKSIRSRLWLGLRVAGCLWRSRRSIREVFFNVPAFHDGLPAMLAARLAGLPLFFCFEDERGDHLANHAAGHGRFAGWLLTQDDQLCDRWLSPRAAGIIAISSYLERKYRALGCRRIVRVPTVVPVEEWRQPPLEDMDDPRFFYSGVISREFYDFEQTLRSLGALAREGRRFRIVYVVAQPERSGARQWLAKLVADLGLESRVEILPFMPAQELKVQLKAATFLLCVRLDNPRAQSGLSTKLSEYLATGRPVITSRVGDAADLLADGESAVFVDPGRPEDLTARLRECVTMPAEKANAIGAAGAAVAAGEFGLPVIAQRLRELR